MVSLTPLSFLRRSSDVYPDKVAVVGHGQKDISYVELRGRADGLSDVLRQSGFEPGDRVAVLVYNGLAMIDAHFGIPGAECILVALNTRLSAEEYRYILNHCGAKVLIVDKSLAGQLIAVLPDIAAIVQVIEVGAGPEVIKGSLPYELWLRSAVISQGMVDPADENTVLAINYTSGTTGRPKGVMYTHRGAYLNALGTALSFGLNYDSVYLWTLPMFHCNGWCFVWSVSAMGARHVCIPRPDPDAINQMLTSHDVTHLAAAPVVLESLINHESTRRLNLRQVVRVATGGAPPSPRTISMITSLGMSLTHLYGLTETYGPCLVCELQPSWEELPLAEKMERMSRQGVRTITVGNIRVVDSDLKDVKRDGTEMGEIVCRSNSVMAGYFNDDAATAAAFQEGWFRTGDLAVMHEDGYIEIRDRAKDIIISGGENISSVEVENALMSHPEVLEVAVISRADERWGEVPVAVVVLRSAGSVSGIELIEYVQGKIARFKAPKSVFFAEIPKTSTGKIQKAILREKLSAGEFNDVE